VSRLVGSEMCIRDRLWTAFALESKRGWVILTE
jgi:hypothetical protein